MLAVAWRRGNSVQSPNSALDRRLAASLCAGIGGYAGASTVSDVSFAYRALRWSAAQARSWRPATLPNGRLVVFHGYFDNADDIAADLNVNSRDHSMLYGLAVDRWGDDTERLIIGEYCAVLADPDRQRLRLSRSPLRGPPLYYSVNVEVCAAASVPRALFAAGVPQRLNEVLVADSAMNNFDDEEATWFVDVAQVPTGAIVDLEPGRTREIRKTYDILAIPNQSPTSDADVVATASRLLNEGVRVCMAGFAKPGATLSGGLDSPQVAIRALEAMPPGAKLPTFTFHPEPGFDGRAPRGALADERPFVEALAKMHPRLEPHFTANEGYGHDHRWRELFHLIGGAPAPLSTMYVFHGILSDAAREGCDLLLLAEFGNLTFSDRGECGFVEYLLTGRWRQLWLALTRWPLNHGSIARRIVARSLSALLPDRLWHPLRSIVLRRPSQFDLLRPLSQKFRRDSGADHRLASSTGGYDRYQPRSRRHSRQLLFQKDSWKAEVYQGFEQLYGVPLRDPTAYRPFVEYCLGLPTRMFMRDGELRWLAKQMAKGIMPEEQRKTHLHGWWDADWHLRMSRRRAELLAEVNRMASDDRFSEMFDIPRLRAALEDWPTQTETDPAAAFPRQLAVPMALLTARFVEFVEGRNEPR